MNQHENYNPNQEELCNTEGANKHKTSDSADGQVEDVNQQIAKYKEAIRDLRASILSMETFPYQQQARERGEEIARLEAKVSSLEKIVDQQEREHKKEIEYFKARVPTVDAWLSIMGHGVNTEHKREIERLKEKHGEEIQRLGEQVLRLKEIQRLQPKVSSMEHVANTEHKQEIERLKEAYNKEIRRLGEQALKLEKDIDGLQPKVSSMEHVAKMEHKQEIERLEKEYEKEIQHLREQVLELEKEIERLQLQASCEEDAKQPNTRQASNPSENPNERSIDSSQPPQAQNTKHSGTAANQEINGSDQEPEEQNTLPPRTSASDKQTNTPLPQAVVLKADSLSVNDVADLVKALNAEIGQIINLLTESLPDSDPELPASDVVFDELHNYLGTRLCDKLRETSEPDPLITQLALQTGLASACNSVVNDSPFWCDGSVFQTLYKRMAKKEGQAAADEWRAKASNYLDLPQCEDANKQYLTEVLLKVATAAVGGKNGESLLSQYNQHVEGIAKMAAKLHKTITEDVTSLELITYTVSCDTEFDASRMEDSENKHVSPPHGKVICTQEMGLLCRKRVEPKKPRGSLKDWRVTMKAKVVLATTMEDYKRK